MEKRKKELLDKLSDSEFEFLEILSQEMNTQDSRSTAYPIWRICDVETKYGVYDSYADGYCIVDVESERVFKDPNEFISLILKVESENLDKEFGSIEEVLNNYNCCANINKFSLKSLLDFALNVLEWEGYLYCGYTEVIRTYKEFFTEREAQHFLEENKHKYSDEVYLCVDSAYGNNQMMLLMDILKKIA